jgi:hypothetical protein
MNGTKIFLSSALVALCLSATAAQPAPSPSAAWESMERTGSIVTFSGLDKGSISVLLSASQQLVVNPVRGIAVAEVLPGQLSRIAGLKQDSKSGNASEASFLAEVQSIFPDYRPETASSHGYLSKTPSHKVFPKDSPATPRVERRGASPEATCLYESFEEIPIWYEDGGPWFHFESGKNNNEGDYFWLDEDCTAATGTWSVSGVMGGDYGQSLHCGDTYDTLTDSWMKYAYYIDCASDQSSAKLSFAMRLQSEQGYDTFGYYASLDDIEYWGYYYSGNYSDYWYAVDQDLRNWYGIGDLTAYSDFALAFNFYSDDRNQVGFGAYLDDVAITYDILGIDDVVAYRGPFRLKVYGTSFQVGSWVYIDGRPAPAVAYKSSGLIVAKGGPVLKGMVNVGHDVCVQVVDLQGNTSPCFMYRFK